MCTSTDLEDFGTRERIELIKILEAWNAHGLPEDFNDKGVTPMFNSNSGYVFLTNSEYEVCMECEGKLESFYTCRNCGHEGFAGDCDLSGDGCNECN